MVNCSKCGKESNKPNKKWKHGTFDLQSFQCTNCGTQFREYMRKGNHSFMLVFHNGKGWAKPKQGVRVIGLDSTKKELL